ncbi:isochorismatase family protein [Pigmentiphaga kullae]|uniref:Nicotinamidase-related amidase n=1 Tax=Pigmentiphaga kullae TaxID=151784 RepID=A0A4Q7NG24_9BURK|nr:isochorismatase family protein [Pigmentiphaga kullae]RZS81657.1 nicotinamidase-related amidase [Pigmentiphaga kullae]
MQDQDNIRSGFNGTLTFGHRPALLIVDFQRGFTEPALSPLASDCGAAVLATNELIDAMRGVGTVIFTLLGYQRNLSDMGAWGRKCTSLDTLIQGTPTCEIDPRLHYDPATDLVLRKTQASAFFGTPLSALLAARRCDSLIVAGATTSGCVRASVVDAMQNAFPPFVVQECVADRSAAQHASNLVDMQSKYAEVVSLARMRQMLEQLK